MYLRFSICRDAILLNLCNTDAIEKVVHPSTGNHLRNDVEEMSLPHSVEVGEYRVLDPEPPAEGPRARCQVALRSSKKVTTSGILTQTLYIVRVLCVHDINVCVVVTLPLH